MFHCRNGRDQTELYLDSILTSDIAGDMVTRRQRWFGIVWLLVLLSAGSIGIYTARRPILRAAGWALVVNQQVESADVIILAIDADGGGVLEAVDLVHSGVATRVAVFTEPTDTMVAQEFLRRGVFVALES